jgi:hypothetical protein
LKKYPPLTLITAALGYLRVLQYFFLAAVHILDLAHLGITASRRQAMSLTEDVLRMEFERFFWTSLDTERVSIAQITFERMLDILMKEHGTEGAACKALVTGDALFLVQSDDPVLFKDGVGGAAFTAFWYSTLLAHNGHTDDRMRIQHHHPHAAFFGIVGVLAADAAGKFADSASGAPLRYDCKMHLTPPVELHTGFEKPIYITERGGDCQRLVEGGAWGRKTFPAVHVIIHTNNLAYSFLNLQALLL